MRNPPLMRKGDNNMDIGYIQRSILSMSQEEQKDFILSNANIDVVIPELDKRRKVLLELPNELEKGSRVYVATLAALGGTIRQIYSTVDLYKKKEIELIALKENFSSMKEGKWMEDLEKFSRLEIEGSFCKEKIEKRPRHGGKEKMVLTPEQEQVLYEYECNLLTQKEAREKIGVSHTTFYRFLNEYRSRNVDCKGILEAYMINRMIQ